MVGDIIGRPGRKAIQKLLPDLQQQYKLDLVIANAENTAGGFGLTLSTAKELFDAGIDVLTSGNHIWAQKEIIPYLDSEMPILRPLNYPPGVPGKGYLIKDQVMIVNLIGRTFIGNFDCPFRAMDKVLAEVKPKPLVIIVDFHAEATSEKEALGCYLDGKVSSVHGTHTHVQTADERVVPNGTAYMSDLGYSGALNSMLGMRNDEITLRFITQMPHRFVVETKGPFVMFGTCVEVDVKTGKAVSIKRLKIVDEELSV